MSAKQVFLWVCTASFLVHAARAAEPSHYARIHVVDDQTGRGVPLVELETVHHILYLTDSAGIVAIDEPGLMGREVFFLVRSHGYEFPKDGFGIAGVRLKLEPGGSSTVKIKRINIAERLYRITGQGIYRDSLLLGDTPPIRHPLLNGQVAGQDSCVNAIYHGKLYWFWGDTLRPSYPLGNYHVSGAVSDLPGSGGLDPAAGVNLEYFVGKDGFSRGMFPNEKRGTVWIFGPMVLQENGREVLATHYSRQNDLNPPEEHGIGIWNDEKELFEKKAEFPKEAPLHPYGQPVEVSINGERWFYFPNPYPVVRVRAKLDDVLDPARYEAFTCYKAGTKEVERDSGGRPAWGWKANTPTVRHAHGLFEKSPPYDGHGPDGIYHLTDVETGQSLMMHGGSVFWNEYRHKWVMIGQQAMGRSMLGELWYAEAETILGPWVYARRIITHDKYTMYNVKQHPYFDQEGGRLIYFEGTYTDFFSGASIKTPLYDYNQMMYRLDLSDERLSLPQPVYVEGHAKFYAIPTDRNLKGSVAVPADHPAFRGLPADSPRNAMLVPLYESKDAQGKITYSTEGNGQPACLVWKSPRVDPLRQPEAKAVAIVK